MKDYYDVSALSENFAFDGPELQEAVASVSTGGTPGERDT